MKLDSKKKIIAFFLSSFIVVTTVVYSIVSYAAVTDWCSVSIKQASVGLPRGCTVCTLHLIVLNSGTIKPEYACSGQLTSFSGNFEKLHNDTNNGAGYHQGQSWVIPNFASCAGTVTNATWTWVGAVEGEKGYTNVNNYIVGLGSKSFSSMTHAEQLACMKAIWNAGYYTVVGVKYNDQDNNGPAGYRASHATMLAGVDANDFYLNDPATGTIRAYKDAKNHGVPYNLVYVILFKCSAGKVCDNPGTGTVVITNEDKVAGSNIGLSVADLQGDLYSERDIAAKMIVDEVDISDSFEVDRFDLEQEDINNLAAWEDNVHNKTDMSSPIYWLRLLMMFMGIIIMVWSFLLYLAYWFDRLNTFIDIDLLGIMSLGRLHMSDTEEECNFKIKNLGSTERKTVNHKAIISIAIIGIAFGTLIVTGLIYKIIATLVNFILIALGQR